MRRRTRNSIATFVGLAAIVAAVSAIAGVGGVQPNDAPSTSTAKSDGAAVDPGSEAPTTTKLSSNPTQAQLDALFTDASSKGGFDKSGIGTVGPPESAPGVSDAAVRAAPAGCRFVDLVTGPRPYRVSVCNFRFLNGNSYLSMLSGKIEPRPGNAPEIKWGGITAVKNLTTNKIVFFRVCLGMGLTDRCAAPMNSTLVAGHKYVTAFSWRFASTQPWSYPVFSPTFTA